MINVEFDFTSDSPGYWDGFEQGFAKDYTN